MTTLTHKGIYVTQPFLFLFYNQISIWTYFDMHYLRPLHTRDWEPVTITLQALSLVEKRELVQVHLTLRSRDQRSMWMQEGCKIYMHAYMASNGSCFMITRAISRNHLLEGRPNIKSGDHGTLNSHICWFILLYYVWEPTWIEIASLRVG